MRLEKSFLILTTMLKGVKNNLYNKLKKYFIIISLVVPVFIILGSILSYKIFSPMISAIITGNQSMFFSFISSNMTVVYISNYRQIKSIFFTFLSKTLDFQYYM